MSVPYAHGVMSGHTNGQFRPIIYAEKALAALLNGVLVYALFCVIGLGLASLNFEGMLGHNVNWWLVFLPFWCANLAILVAHLSSIRHAKKLRQWAEVDSMSNEPLLPLLRRIVMIYAVSFPLSVLLLWSQLAFCARLENSATSLYICYAPLMLIQAAFVVRYLLCRSDSTLPGVCWVLGFVFTFLMSYQTNASMRLPEPSYPLSWWTVAAPLFTLEALFGITLVVVLVNEFKGIYSMTRWQLGAIALYAFALISLVTGQLMLLENIDYHWGSVFFPSTMLLLGLVSASVAMYIVGRHHVQDLMATRGGAVPVPLTKTRDGWVTSHAALENWIMLGDIPLTDYGLDHRNRASQRRNSAMVEADDTQRGNSWLKHVSKTLTRNHKPKEALAANEPERRIQNVLQRKTSGSYSDIAVDVDTPKG